MGVSIPGAAGTHICKRKSSGRHESLESLWSKRALDGEPTRLVLEKQNNATYEEEYTAPKAALSTQVREARARRRLHSRFSSAQMCYPSRVFREVDDLVH